MGQLIGILGGNHVLHRSLIAAAQQAGHRAIVHDGRAFARQPSRARPEPPSDTTATMPVAALADAVIIVDPTLVPGGEFAPAELASIPQERAHTRRTILAFDYQRARPCRRGAAIAAG